MIKTKIFESLATYSKIWNLAQNLDPKISNLAYDKMQYIFVELIFKFDGLHYLAGQLDKIEDEHLLSLIGWFMMSIDQNIAKNILSKLLNSKSETIKFKANYSLQNLDNPKELESIQNVIDLNKKKLKIS